MSSELQSEALALLRKLGGSKLLVRLIDVFSQSALRRISEARAAQDSGDVATVRRLAHSLKSSSGQLARGVCRNWPA